MLFTLFVCIIFLFLTVTIGFWVSFVLSSAVKPLLHSTFQNFLLGFAFIACYLNTWSLFLPANYYSLLPLFILSAFVARYSKGTVKKIGTYLVRLCSSQIIFFAIPILLVIVVYSLLPPQHGDSPGYHFLTIRWNEQFKGVPGLANLHGRLGFNSSFFVASAAFAFSSFAGQPLYVLNIVFVVCYYLWLINKVCFYKNTLWSVVFGGIAILIFRQLLDSISSPTPDVLSTILISWVFITVAEHILVHGMVDQSEAVVLILLICFSFTVKLNTFPLCLIGLFLFVKAKLYSNRKAFLKLTIALVIILVPWIIRNYILTGYLIFPVAATGFLHPDWQVPHEILHFEKLLINNGPKLISQDWEAVDSLSFLQWFPLWLKAHPKHGLTFSLVILVAASISAIAALFLIKRKQEPSLYWLAVINIIAIAFWMYNSPDYRFGYPYLINALLLLALCSTKNKKSTGAAKRTAAALVIIICSYYIRHAVSILSHFPLSSFVVKPLPGSQFNSKTNLSGFPFIMLNKKVKLYVEDKEHWCNWADVPCYIPFTDSLPASDLELRGPDISDGFRIIKK